MSQEKQQVRLNVNTSEMKTNYANVFQSNSSPEEVFISFGVNHTVPSQEEGVAAEMMLQFSNRMIMNYYTAKRLAFSILQIVREHEERFGVVELDVAKRVSAPEAKEEESKDEKKYKN